MATANPLQAQLADHRRSVDVDHLDITIRELIRMAADQELVIAPEYQRKFRWKEADESRLIESLLLGLPVPSLFVATNPDGTWEVVDGLQRLSTLIHFVAEPTLLLPTVNKKSPLRLVELETLKSFNDHTFDELPTPIKLQFFKRTLRVTALSDKSDVHVRFDLFERLNNGGVALTPQEVRACILRGPFNDFLRELADNDAFRALTKLQSMRQHDATREELVLKLFAYMNDRTNFRGAVGDFLTAYMSAASKKFDYDAARTTFLAAVHRLAAICQGPFLRENYALTPQVEFEAVMVATMELIRDGATVVDPPPGWTSDVELVEASGGGSNSLPMLNRRIDRAKVLLSAVPA